MTALAVFSGDLWAGAEVMICTLLTELHRAGRIPVVALSLNEGTLTERLRAAAIETHVIPEHRYAFPRILLQALRLLRGRPVSVIHSHRYKENALATALAAILRPRRLLATVHGLPEPPPARRRLPDPAVRLNTALLRRRFSHVVAVSHDIRRRLTGDFGLTPERVSVIHNGLRLPPPSAAPADAGGGCRGLHVGSVGRLVPVKDFPLFLETAARIRARHHGVRFSILGDGPARGELLRKAIALGLSNCFQILPPMADPLPYYRTLDVYLNTSRHEGIPMSILEAMSCGVPVVAPAVGGIPEVLSHGVDGLLIGSRAAQDYADTCLALMGEDERRCALGRRAQETVAERFSAAAMAARYLELYAPPA
jgi:glycosyltransferase involved in cell wall biosynthesis